MLKFHSWISPVTHFSCWSFPWFDPQFSRKTNKQAVTGVRLCQNLLTPRQNPPFRLVFVSREHVWLASNELCLWRCPAGQGVLLTIPVPVWLTLIWISWFFFLALMACGSIKHHAAQWVWIKALQSTPGGSERNWKSSNLSVSAVRIQASTVQPNHLACHVLGATVQRNS